MDSSDNQLIIRQVRSVIGRPPRQRRTLRSLGLRRIGQEVRRQDSPAVRGAVRAVAHLVEVESADSEDRGGSS